MQSTSNAFIFGIRAVLEAVQAGDSIQKVFIHKTIQSPLLATLCKLAKQRAIPCSYVPTQKLDRLTKGNHQGVVAIVSPIDFAALEEVIQSTFAEGRIPLVVVLDGITDVHNVGAIARTACCMGADLLVVPASGLACLAGVAMKTSAGALSSIPVARVEHLSNALRYLQASGLQIIACQEKGNRSIHQVDLTPPTALIMGDESKGIHPSHQKWATCQVAIPIKGPIASLNVSVAAGMVLYETAKQRQSIS